MRLAVVMLVVVVMLSGCGTADDAPAGADSSGSGAAATVVADQATLPGPELERPGYVGVATTSDQRDAQWDRFRLTDSQPSVDFADRVLLFVGFGESGSCPYIFDGIEVDDQTLRMLDAQDQEVCTSDFQPRTVVLSIDRGVLPEGFLTVDMPDGEAVISLSASAEPPPASPNRANTPDTPGTEVKLALEPDSVPAGDDVAVQIANTTEQERVRTARWVRIDRWTGHHFEAVGEIDPGEGFVEAGPGETVELMTVSTADPVFAAAPAWYRVTAPSLNFMSGDHGRISEAHDNLQIRSSAASAPESPAPEPGGEPTDEDPAPAPDPEDGEGGPNDPAKDPAVVSLMDDYDEQGPCDGGEPPEPEDVVIDADGTASRFSGDPDAREVGEGDELSTFPVDSPNDSGLDAFDQDGDGQWTMSEAGEAGDDLHVEGPAFCDTGQRDSVHQEGQDCLVLDTNDDLATGDQVDCDLEIGADLTGSFDSCPPDGVTYHDANDNGAWDDGEDIVQDSNGNLVFD